MNATTLLLTLAGPADVWHGIGLNASAMATGTYAVVVDGTNDGTVSEHVLQAQAGGSVLPRTPGLAVHSQTVNKGRRVTSLSLPLVALAQHHVIFEAMLVHAVGCSAVQCSVVSRDVM